jgi:hypothetical protein
MKFNFQKSKLISALNFISMLSMFLMSDIYYPGLGRLFDYMSIILLIVALFFGLSRLINEIEYFKFGLIYLLLGPWIFFGVFFNDAFLAVSAISIGILIVLPINRAIVHSLTEDVIAVQIKIIILISSIILLIQSLAYYGGGYLLDLTRFFGAIESRSLNEEINYFRPAGIFQEPNMYCTVMFCLLSACSLFQKRSLRIELIGIVGILFTQSLWGFGAVVVLVYLLYGTKPLIWLLISFGAMGGLVIAFSGLTVQDIADASITIKRIIDIDNDPSRQARFGSFDNFELDAFIFFGHGVDTEKFQSIAANGFAFIIYSFGLIGMLLIVTKRATRESYMPFGPYLAFGAWISYLWGDQLFEWYWSMMMPMP